MTREREVPVRLSYATPEIPATARSAGGEVASERPARLIARVTAVLLLGSLLMLRGQTWARQIFGLPTGETQLLYAAMDGDSQQTAQALLQGMSPNATDSSGVPALTWAAKSGNQSCVLLLLRAGADISAMTPMGVTPLSAAAMTHKCCSAETLLTHGADPNEYMPHHGTPLYTAVLLCDEEMVDLLLRYGADPNLACADGTTPLKVASNRHIRERLIAAGARESA